MRPGDANSRRKPLRVWLLLLLPCSGLAAQSQRSVLVRTDRAAGRQQLECRVPRDTRRASALPDVVLLWPGAPVVQGAERAAAIVCSTALLEHRTSLKATWQPIGAELSLDSTLGVTWGVTVAPSERCRRSGDRALHRDLATRDRSGEGYLASRGDDVHRSHRRWIGTESIRTSAGTATAQARRATSRPSWRPTSTLPARGRQWGGVAFERWAAPDAHMFAGGGILVTGTEGDRQGGERTRHLVAGTRWRPARRTMAAWDGRWVRR